MKVLIADDAHTFGGAQIAAVNLARFIKENSSYEVQFYFSQRNTRLTDRLHGIAGVRQCNAGYVASPFFLISQFQSMWRLFYIVRKIKSLKPDVIIVNMAGLEFGWLYIYAAKLLGLNLICWLHNPYKFSDLMPKTGLRRFQGSIRDFLADIFAKIIFNNLYTVSETSRSYLLDRFNRPDGISILGNTVFSKPFFMKSENIVRTVVHGFNAEKIVLVPGRISFCHKGQDQIVACLEEFARRAIAVIFVGDGEDTDNLKEACKEYKNVFFVGWQASVERYIECADAVLLPSRFEAQPLIAMEVMALQIPILTSEIPSFVELVGSEFSVDFSNTKAVLIKIEWLFSLDSGALQQHYKKCSKKFRGPEYKSSVFKILNEC